MGNEIQSAVAPLEKRLIGCQCMYLRRGEDLKYLQGLGGIKEYMCADPVTGVKSPPPQYIVSK